METKMDGGYGVDWSVAERVRAIIAQHAMLKIDMVLPEVRLADLGLDSLMLVETIFGLEEAFDIAVPFNANDPAQSQFDLSTVGTMIAGVEALIAAR
jgi:acyl carrier protein